jgi:2-iminoacetate synthase
MNIRHDTDRSRIRDILAKSSELEVLNLSEVSSLIALSDRGIWEEVFEAANRVKEKVYGRRIVLFAPLYLSNECANDCMYCGFRRSNRDAVRKSLTVPEAVGEAALLSKRGYRRLLLVASEQSGQRGIDYLTEVVGRIYEDTDMRILHLNSAPVGVEDFRRLKESGVGVYQCFQETYHIPTYRSMHRRGPKSDYSWRLDAMDRAIAGGFEDIGLGVLLGLYDWKWDIAALVAHSLRLLKKYGVAIFRLALPYVGIVISTREQAALRDQLFFIGASQISAGSKTSPWGYVDGSDTEQFEIGDTRSLDEVIDKIMSLGLIPSLCTACYREGRSGERFRQLTEEGVIKKYCRENALLSLKEYVEDYVTGERKDFLLQRLEEEVSKSTNGLFGRFREIEEGTRDLHL